MVKSISLIYMYRTKFEWVLFSLCIGFYLFIDICARWWSQYLWYSEVHFVLHFDETKMNIRNIIKLFSCKYIWELRKMHFHSITGTYRETKTCSYRYALHVTCNGRRSVTGTYRAAKTCTYRYAQAVTSNSWNSVTATYRGAKHVPIDKHRL